MHLIENKGVKSERMKFGENSRQMPSVSTIYDEYCRHRLRAKRVGKIHDKMFIILLMLAVQIFLARSVLLTGLCFVISWWPLAH